jgi:hypothetical protein
LNAPLIPRNTYIPLILTTSPAAGMVYSGAFFRKKGTA